MKLLRVVAPFLISQCYNSVLITPYMNMVVAPFLISQCYNISYSASLSL